MHPRNFPNRARNLVTGAVLALGLAWPMASAAQSPFSPAITVNDRAISYYEIDQRIIMLELFRIQGDLPELAREQLIEDRLKMQEFDRVGIQLTDEGLLQAMTDFAGRANLELDQFIATLSQNGVSEETFRDYVSTGITWRDYIRSRYASRVDITDADVDRALAELRDTSAGIEVLMSEIIIPAPPPRAAEATATAERISRLTSTAAFEAEARRVSALPSRDNGGRLDWLPLTNYPAPLRPILLALEPGQVTAPIQITNGVALFQMRAVREVPLGPADPAVIEYATFLIPGNLAGTAQAEAAHLRARVDVCDDLYGVARGLPPQVLEVESRPVAEIPQDIAFELAKLDPGEASTALTRNNGDMLVFLMMCNRTAATDEVIDRETVANQLRSRRLAGYADALLADLKAAAAISLE